MDVEPFTRSPTGQIAKHLFYREILVWVEGRTDIPFYRPVLAGLTCRFEVSGGKEQSLTLAHALILHNYPYVVVVDGDYRILERVRSPHRRAIFLQRHSCENYLFEREPIRDLFRKYVDPVHDDAFIQQEYDRVLALIHRSLRKLVILDVAHCRQSTGHKVLPDNAEALISPADSINFDRPRILKCEKESKSAVSRGRVAEARSFVTQFLLRRRLVDLLRGHFAFSLLRRLLLNTIKAKRGDCPNIDNDTLRILLCEAAWSLVRTPDHSGLKRRLRRAAREAARLRLTDTMKTAQKAHNMA